MTPVGMEPLKLTSAQQVKPSVTKTENPPASTPLKVEQNKVTLSDEGKALLAALQEIEKIQKLKKKPTRVLETRLSPLLMVLWASITQIKSKKKMVHTLRGNICPLRQPSVAFYLLLFNFAFDIACSKRVRHCLSLSCYHVRELVGLTRTTALWPLLPMKYN